MTNPHIKVVLAVSVFAMLCIVYFLALQLMTYRKKKPIGTIDPMNRVLFHIGDQPVAGWPLSHFNMYVILGFLFPNYWPILWVVGVIWELIESFIAIWDEGKRHPQVNDAGNVYYPYNWWQGSWKDILYNTTGLVVGISLRYVADKAFESSRKRASK